MDLLTLGGFLAALQGVPWDANLEYGELGISNFKISKHIDMLGIQSFNHLVLWGTLVKQTFAIRN